MSSDRKTILLQRYSRTIHLVEETGGWILHLDDDPAPLETVYLSREELRTLALAILAAIGDESNDQSR